MHIWYMYVQCYISHGVVMSCATLGCLIRLVTACVITHMIVIHAVKQAVELNRKLQYVSEHQKCILEGYRRELESCRQQLVDTRVSLADRQAEMVEGGEQAGRRTRATEQDLKMV